MIMACVMYIWLAELCTYPMQDTYYHTYCIVHRKARDWSVHGYTGGPRVKMGAEGVAHGFIVYKLEPTGRVLILYLNKTGYINFI